MLVPGALACLLRTDVSSLHRQKEREACLLATPPLAALAATAAACRHHGDALAGLIAAHLKQAQVFDCHAYLPGAW